MVESLAENIQTDLPLFRPEALSRAELDIFGASLRSEQRFLFHTGLVTLGAVMLGACVLAMPYAEWVDAEGDIQSRGSTTELRSARAGTVTKVSAQNGINVHKRQQIFDIRPQDGTAEDFGVEDADSRATAHQLDAIEASQTRTLEKIGITRDQQRLAARSVATTIRSLDSSIALQGEAIAILKRNIAAKKELVKKGFFATMALDDIERTLAAERQRSIELSAQRTQALQSSVIDAANRRQAVLGDQSDFDRLAQQKAELEAQAFRQKMSGRSIVRAEADGQITDVHVKVGDSVLAGQLLGRVLSRDDRLEAELHVNGRAAAVARPGMKLRLSLEAFPFQQFGWAYGTIRYVDAVATHGVDQSTSNGTKTFRVIVDLSRKTMSAYGKGIPILRGTTVKAQILVRSRTVLGWLVEPLQGLRNPQ